MSHYAKGTKSNNKIIGIKNLWKWFKFIGHFNLFSKIKHIFTRKIFSQNGFSLQKWKNKISSCTFPMRTIPSLFGEVKLAAHASENG